VLTALSFSYPPKEAAELALMLAIIVPLYLVNIIVLGLMWWKPPGGRHLGLTRGIWSGLIAVASLIGLSEMFAA
jgi:hypothetical protein